MIGTGGIGSGMFFALKGNHTLGREESRGGWFLNRRDYCKLHIISHYVRVLLGPAFPTILIGKVGDDPTGQRICAEMTETGLDIRYVCASHGDQSLFSVCFTYPDGTGGNLTSDDSACSKVDADWVARAEPDFIQYQGRGITLAAPEVPLAARQKLLELATKYKFLRVASFVSAEMEQAMQMGLPGQLDLMALNIDEAAAITGLNPEKILPEEIIQHTVARISREYPHLQLSLTAGKTGSWSWDGADLHFQPSFPAPVVSTAGAGDAHIAGIITGLAVGLSLAQAQQLGGLIAALSITSPHTIAPEVCKDTLREYVQQLTIAQVNPAVLALLTKSN
jgi:ribokinase